MARSPQVIRPDGRPVILEGDTPLAAACSTWQGVPVELRDMQGSGEMGPMYTPFPSLVLCVRGDGNNDVTVGRSTVRVPFVARSLVLHEAGFQIDRCKWHGTIETIGLQLPPDIVSQLTNFGDGRLSIQSKMPFKDEVLAGIVSEIGNELERGCSSGRLFAQGMSLALIGYLNSRYGVSSTSRRESGKLTQKDMARIVEYVQQHLTSDLGIEELSSLLSLSPSQFSRLFKRTTGISPYRFVQQKRIERALELMRGSDSLSEIAQGVGLTSQSHFTQVFRQLTGATPAQARLTMRSSK